MIGIYLITSPSGKVYIGQSVDIDKRLRYYTNWKSCKSQLGISRSIKKYGWANHSVNVLSLIRTRDQKELDRLENYFINKYRREGYQLLNLKEGGIGGRLSESSIEKIKAKRALQSPPTLGLKYSLESREKMSAWQRGRKMSNEAIENNRLAQTGRKASEEARANMRKTKAVNNVWIGRKHTLESRAKQRIAKIGHKINNKKVVRVDTNQIFDSCTDAAESIDISMKALSARIRNGSMKSPIFRYV